MAHRNVHFFRRQPTIIYNQIQNYNLHNCCGGFMGGSLWSNPMMLMELLYAGKSMVGGLFTNKSNDYASFNRYQNPWAMTPTIPTIPTITPGNEKIDPNANNSADTASD